MSRDLVGPVLAMPGRDAGLALTRFPEDQWFERKSARIAPRQLADSLIGMANADGGVLVVGLSDGTVEGTDRMKGKRNELMQASIDHCEPPLRTSRQLIGCLNELGEPDHLLIIEVSASDHVHSNRRDEVFLRVGDENRRLTFRQRQELLFDKGQASYESQPLAAAAVDTVNEDLVAEYSAAVGTSDSANLLLSRGLAAGETLTIAGCLLFSGHPQLFMPQAFVRVLRYRGRERGTGERQQLMADVRIDGPIPLQLRAARQAIREFQPVRQALVTATGRFGDVPLIPEEAWIEGLVNAVVHRSYSIAGDHIRVEIFDDRIEVSSPGRFPGLADPQKPIETTRFARNPRIARVCAELRFGEELGEGVRRIFEEMRRAGLHDPVYRQTSGGVVLALPAEPADGDANARLSDRGRATIAALRAAGRLRTGEIAELLGVSRPVAQKELAALREEGAIEWVGQSSRDPRAYWRLRST